MKGISEAIYGHGKLALAVFMGIIVFLIIVGIVATVGSTECWRNTFRDFNNKFAVSTYSMQKSSLGTEYEFIIRLPVGSCLKSVWFIERDKWSDCFDACSDEDFGFHGSHDAVEECKEDCSKKCGINKGDCIVLVPVRKGREAPLHRSYEKFAFWVAPTPIVYSSKDIELDFDGLEMLSIDWDWGDDELTIRKDGRDTETTFDNNMISCLIFKSSNKDSYSVDFRGECEDGES